MSKIADSGGMGLNRIPYTGISTEYDPWLGKVNGIVTILSAVCTGNPG
jgi:hypothetical protein